MASLSESIGMEEFSDQGEELEDNDVVDDAAHEQLLNSLFALDGKQRNKNEVRGISTQQGNLDLVVHAKKDEGKIKPQDLKLKGRGSTGTLKKPMTAMETEQVKREIARDAMVTEMTSWEPVVQEIRLAPQMLFSKRPHGMQMYNAMKPKGFTPRTPLEKELFAALGQSEDVLRPNKELTAAEERALKAMSVSEAMERRAELLKHNELLSRAQIRAKRMKKIKSKRYRKILRKEREGAERKELEQLKTSDPQAFVEKMEQLEKDRMEERLTLKHRGGGKFSRLHKIYSKFDDKTRDAMQDMLQKSRELTKKTAHVSDSDEDDDDNDDNSNDKESDEDAGNTEENEITNDAFASRESDSAMTREAVPAKMSRLEMLKAINKKAGGWLDSPETTFVYDSKRKPEGEKCGAEQSVDDSSTPMQDIGESNELTALAQDDSESLPKSKETSGKKRKAGKSAALDDPVESDVEEVEHVAKPKEFPSEPSSEPKKKRRKRNKKKSGEEDEETADPKPKPVVEKTLEAVDVEGAVVDGEDDQDGEEDSSMKVTMEELFQDEDVVEEFAREKAAAEEQARPKVEDTRLPGWGQWAGPDYKAERPKSKKQKRAEARAKLLEKQQQKVQQPHVWLNPKRDDSIRKLQPKQVPFPYTSVQQYEAFFRQPVSRGFVPETAFKMLNKPETVTKLGHIIKPLDKADVFRKEKKAGLDGSLGPVVTVGVSGGGCNVSTSRDKDGGFVKGARQRKLNVGEGGKGEFSSKGKHKRKGVS